MGSASMPINRKTKPSGPGLSSALEPSAPQELPEIIDRLYRKIQEAPPGKKKWAVAAVDELNRLMDLSETVLADAASDPGLAIVRAQSSPEYLNTLRSLDPLAPAFARGARARLELLKEGGGVYTTERVAEILNISPQTVVKWHNSGKLLALTFGRGGLRFPRWQFDLDKAAAVPGLDQVLAVLSKHDAWMQNVFFLSSNGRLNDRRPLDVLKEGGYEPVLDAARAFLQQGAA
jgi:hypothetical protein